jgi:hypothetical protein
MQLCWQPARRVWEVDKCGGQGAGGASRDSGLFRADAGAKQSSVIFGSPPFCWGSEQSQSQSVTVTVSHSHTYPEHLLIYSIPHTFLLHPSSPLLHPPSAFRHPPSPIRHPPSHTTQHTHHIMASSKKVADNMLWGGRFTGIQAQLHRSAPRVC